MARVFDVPYGLPRVYPDENKPEDEVGQKRRQIFNSLYSATRAGLVVIRDDGRSLRRGPFPKSPTTGLLVKSFFAPINPVPFGKQERPIIYGAGLAIGDTGLPIEGGKPVEDDDLTLLKPQGSPDRVAWRYLLAAAHHLEAHPPRELHPEKPEIRQTREHDTASVLAHIDEATS